MKHYVLIPAILLVFACGQPDTITADCNAHARDLVTTYGTAAQLRGAYSSPFQAVLDWRTQRSRVLGRQPDLSWSDLSPAATVSTCFYDGTFGGLSKGPPGGPVPTYDRLVVVVRSDGRAELASFGTSQNTPVSPPSGSP